MQAYPIMFNDIIIPLFCLKCCFMSLDAVDCVWNEFEEWSACTKDCGGGKRSRSRTIKTEASNGGRKCTGVTSEQESCNTHGCKGKHCTFFHIANYTLVQTIEANANNYILHFLAVDGNWGQWSPFTRCNTACKKTRTKLCNDPSPKNNGNKCVGGNGFKQVQTANCHPKYCGKHPPIFVR